MHGVCVLKKLDEFRFTLKKNLWMFIGINGEKWIDLTAALTNTEPMQFPSNMEIHLN